METKLRGQKRGCASIHGKGTKPRRTRGITRPVREGRRGNALCEMGEPNSARRGTSARSQGMLAELIREWQETGLATKMVQGALFKARIREKTRDEAKCCTTPLVVEREGTRVCQQCGEVVGEVVFDRREHYWRDREGHLVRQTEPVAAGPRHLGTVMGSARWDGGGRKLPAKIQAKYWRLRDHNKWYGYVPQRSLGIAGRVRRGILSRLEFRDARGISECICEWVSRHKLALGRTVDATTAAAVYVAAVMQEFPATYAEVAAASNVPEARLRHVVALYLDPRPAGTDDFPIKVSRTRVFSPGRYIRHICTKLRLAPAIAVRAEDFAARADQNFPSGHRPETKAAIAVQAACGGTIPWVKLAGAARVQASALRKYWNAIRRFTGENSCQPRVNSASHVARLPS